MFMFTKMKRKCYQKRKGLVCVYCVLGIEKPKRPKI